MWRTRSNGRLIWLKSRVFYKDMLLITQVTFQSLFRGKYFFIDHGFTVIGDPPPTPLLQKSNLQTGDRLYVTKPLGVGVLLASHMRSQCSARDYETLIAMMLQPQHELAKLATECGIVAATDITGFGLAGHLMEMLQASQTSATLDLTNLPLLPGAAEAFNDGIESTLAPNNRVVERSIVGSAEAKARPEYKALFDPQTCGGLLLGVPSQLAAEFENRFQNAGANDLVCIGAVCADGDAKIAVQFA